ncbi:hypothetical protein CA13_34600 [Planctomycetes bacterium CA13]|uniref:Uncharacterized protein n=2 Tax=Novipirellula herctigrandis TaxID=2527986 RepID=A0A5C5Z469_9BACT|nr:hypothetical protein CA13_34600 [Planctomycetes bacterium CA13]
MLGQTQLIQLIAGIEGWNADSFKKGKASAIAADSYCCRKPSLVPTLGKQKMLFLAEMQQAQLWMVAGFILLGWVLARRTIRMRKRVNTDARAANKAIKAIREHKEPSVPLCDAPPEVQRWQIAMYEVQRELTAELDTRIAIVQSLMRQMDARIEMLGMVPPTAASPITTEPIPNELMKREPIAEPKAEKSSRRPHSAIWNHIRSMAKEGLTAKQISEKLNMPLGDVELMLG